MSDSQQPQEANEDAMADVLSALACVLIPVITIVYWLSGMPM